MAGTAGLPHLLTRFYTVPNESEARLSVAWSLLFIAILYLSAPALAVLVKFEVMNNLVGSSFSELPHWLAQWARVDSALVEVSDVNRDGVLQFGELKLGADMIMLASPEMAGLPYVISGLVAAGGFAAALSTADGLLLTISNAFVHDMRLGTKNGIETEEGRVIVEVCFVGRSHVCRHGGSLEASANFGLGLGVFFFGGICLLPGHDHGNFLERCKPKRGCFGNVAGLGYHALLHDSERTNCSNCSRLDR
jgi:cation/acetate symporter